MDILYYDTIMPEDSGRYDFELLLHGNGHAIVRAHELLTGNPSAEIIAALIDNSRTGFYLYGKDDLLYHHAYNDAVLNRHVPLQAFQRYLDATTENCPEEWHYYQCYPSSVYVLIHDSIWKDFLDYLDAYSAKMDDPHGVIYYVGSEFPLFMHHAVTDELGSRA